MFEHYFPKSIGFFTGPIETLVQNLKSLRSFYQAIAQEFGERMAPLQDMVGENKVIARALPALLDRHPTGV
ncbi:hypothetical protein J6590_086037 [Homalodisca vitripennis]|nr:hypothetical protein J6590_086037 [Homalodisca vitripennis]